MFGNKRSKLSGLSKPGDMARQISILGVPLSQHSTPSTSTTVGALLGHLASGSGKPGGALRIASKDDFQKPGQLQPDLLTIEVQLLWKNPDEQHKMNDSTRAIFTSIKTRPIVRKYTPATTMDQVVQECKTLFQSEDVKLELFLSTDEKPLDACDTFEQLVKSRRLFVGSDILKPGKTMYTLHIGFQRPPASDKEDLQRTPVTVKLNSVEELLKHIMEQDWADIKKLTISMELVNGDKLVLTGEI